MLERVGIHICDKSSGARETAQCDISGRDAKSDRHLRTWLSLCPGDSDHSCRAVSIYGNDGIPLLDTRDPKVDNPSRLWPRVLPSVSAPQPEVCA